jgi:hypothetical protein
MGHHLEGQDMGEDDGRRSTSYHGEKGLRPPSIRELSLLHERWKEEDGVEEEVSLVGREATM